MATKIKKKRKIRRRRSGKRNMYFTMDTQAAIVDFQNSDDLQEKEKLYNEQIKYAFEKLVENLIFVYGFHNPYENTKHMQSDCVSFLFETIHKWKKEKGTKAFSYFNVVAKNWLIMNARKTKKISSRMLSLTNADHFNASDKQVMASYDYFPGPDEMLINRELRSEIISDLHSVQKKVRGQKEKACIEAIITVFNNIEELDFLNKRAIFVYVRDISGLNPKQLSVAMSAIRKHYKEIVRIRIQNG